jgi:hypothetical protein
MQYVSAGVYTVGYMQRLGLGHRGRASVSHIVVSCACAATHKNVLPCKELG